MKLTFTDMQTMATEVIGVNDATTLTRVKRDINTGAAKMLAALGRQWNRKSKFTNLVVNQQYYQIPEDAQKVQEVVVNSGGINPPMEQISDEHYWKRINMTPYVGVPNYYYLKGNDEIGLFPVPSLSVTAGIELIYSPKQTQLFADDYTTGTVTVTGSSLTVTGSSTVFIPSMVGMWFQTTDGTDGNWYQIASYVDAATITLNNYYQGPSGGSKAFRIGPTVDFPDEYGEAPSDYACFRHYKRRGDKTRADDFWLLFDSAIQSAKENYAQTTDNQVIEANLQRDARFYNPFRGDPPPNGLTA